MFSTVKAFFRSLGDPLASRDRPPSDHELQVATAALLLEMMRADREISEAEQAAVIRALREKFGLSEEETRDLVQLADEAARAASGSYDFTSVINRGFDAGEKIRVIEYMWQIAYADGHLCAHENHLMRRIADLLHISHGDYCAVKERARLAMTGQGLEFTPPDEAGSGC
ncbi:MAG TPA: TerB family tellurite resistance protein [Rhodocyclaceae bacterium]|nr:TerB family tellurite resistance protein [Rhodocyclaceae bacterium]